MLHPVSHLLIDKEMFMAPEHRVTEITPCILIFSPHFMHIEERIILPLAFLHRLIINTRVSPKAH